jgi:hypothetical protein
MLYFLDSEFLRRTKLNAPPQSGRTLAKPLNYVKRAASPLDRERRKIEPDEPTDNELRMGLEMGFIAAVEDDPTPEPEIDDVEQMDDLEAAIQNEDLQSEHLGAEAQESCAQENREAVSIQSGVAQHENME